MDSTTTGGRGGGGGGGKYSTTTETGGGETRLEGEAVAGRNQTRLTQAEVPSLLRGEPPAAAAAGC